MQEYQKIPSVIKLSNMVGWEGHEAVTDMHLAPKLYYSSTLFVQLIKKTKNK